jgi:diguanylate cyclase (GGDEF)-like protein
MGPTAKDHDSLCASRLFEGVPSELIEGLLPVPRAAEPGERVLDPESPGSELYVVLSGELGIFLDENARLAVAKIPPGSFAGEQSVLDPRASPALVIATEPTRVAAIDTARLWEAMRRSPRIALNLLRVLSERIRHDHASLRHGFERQLALEAACATDSLTGLPNRRWMEDMFERELLRCERAGSSAVLFVIDVDRLKQVNGSLGHPAGDRLLARLAELLRRSMRPRDLCARHGGAEFCVLLPDAQREQARQAAERLRERVAHQPAAISRDLSVGYTVSIGVAAWEPGQTLSDLVRAAQSALCAAKKAGRNRVELAGVEAAST